MESDDGARDLTRREFLETAAAVSGIAAGLPVLEAQSISSHPGSVLCKLSINGVSHQLTLDPRVTLLDLLREQLHLVGTKKGCDHGQCGACTVLVNGERAVSCLALAVCQDGQNITTIEGLGSENRLHPMQAAFLEHDGLQCGFCTPGQICSAVGMLQELRAGAASAVTRDVSRTDPIALSEDELRERMSGNICRCGAYPNIVAAISAVHQRG